jgi:hypothetical protein
VTSDPHRLGGDVVADRPVGHRPSSLSAQSRTSCPKSKVASSKNLHSMHE